MLPLVIFLISSHPVKSSIDLNCTAVDATGALHLTPSAIRGCTDLYSLAACQRMFGIGNLPTASTAPTADVGRSRACFEFSDELKEASIIGCPLYCGWCCVTPAANCPNAPAPRLDCNTITDDMCDSILWRNLIAEDCPGACGFCLLGGCVDAVPDCATQPTICSNTAMANFTEVNCRRTCNLCPTGSTTAVSCDSTGGLTSGSSSCTDRSTDCPIWNRNGFCTSLFYTPAQKQEFCGATCGLC